MNFQLGSALLDACVLAILHKEDTYGYKLTQEVKDMMEVSESTLYPVLRRLTREGYLETYDREHMGRNRRYYRLSAIGKRKYKEYAEEWKDFKKKVDAMLERGDEDDKTGVHG